MWLVAHGFSWARWSVLDIFYFLNLFSNALSYRRFLRSKHLRHFNCFGIIVIILNFSNRWRFSFASIEWFYCFFWTTSVKRWSNWTLRLYLRLHFCLKLVLETFLNLFCLYFNLFLYFYMHFLNHLLLNNCNLLINMLFNLCSNCFINNFSHIGSDDVLLILIHILLDLYLILSIFFNWW